MLVLCVVHVSVLQVDQVDSGSGQPGWSALVVAAGAAACALPELHGCLPMQLCQVCEYKVEQNRNLYTCGALSENAPCMLCMGLAPYLRECFAHKFVLLMLFVCQINILPLTKNRCAFQCPCIWFMRRGILILCGFCVNMLKACVSVLMIVSNNPIISKVFVSVLACVGLHSCDAS